MKHRWLAGLAFWCAMGSTVAAVQFQDISVKLAGLKTTLTTAFQKQPNTHINSADLYLQALARIEATDQLFMHDPKHEYANGLYQTCSLLTQAAVIQLRNLTAESRVLQLMAQRDSILTELGRTHEQITEIERHYGSRLQASLADERRKAQRLRKEAQQRFKELQSELIQVKKDARGTIISMSDILFPVGRAALTKKLQMNLAKIAGILTVYKNAKVIVEGHTDNQGSAEYNQKLSEKRARNVMAYLVGQGVHQSRLKAAGYGFRKPIADNRTKEGRQQNRRVDLVVIDHSAQ